MLKIQSGIDFTGNYTCDYGSPDTYQVAITGIFPQIYFNNTGDKEKILSIEQWGTIEWKSMMNSFSGCSNLAGQAIDTPILIKTYHLGWLTK